MKYVGRAIMTAGLSVLVFGCVSSKLPNGSSDAETGTNSCCQLQCCPGTNAPCYKSTNAVEQMALTDLEKQKNAWLVAMTNQNRLDDARFQLIQTAKAADDLAQYLEEYGSITMSSPMFVRPQTNFAFNLHRGTTNYFSEAKSDINGAVATSEQTAVGLGADLEAQYDPTVVAQYGVQMADYAKQMGALEMKNSLSVSAADSQFKADLLAAQQATNAIAHQQLMAQAYSNYAAAYPAPGSAPQFPTAASVNSALPAFSTNNAGRPEVRDVFTSNQFTSPGGLLPQTSLAVNNRVALNVAAGDVATESILNMLLNPTDAGALSGKDIFFGVATVSINPGTYTTHNYAGELTSRLTLDPSDARSSVLNAMLAAHLVIPNEVLAKVAADVGMPFSNFTNKSGILDFSKVQYELLSGCETNPITTNMIQIPAEWNAKNEADVSAPMVFTVTPGTDVQTLDLESSYRYQLEMSFKLALAAQYAGIKGAANAFYQYASKLESDARTKTSVPVMNAYSVSGDAFGFQIGPQFQALADLTRPKAKGEWVLSRQWFPAIIIMGLETNAIRPTILRRPDNNNTNLIRFIVQEPSLNMAPIVRWVRLDKGKLGLRSRFSEEEYIELSQNLNKRMTQLTKAIAQFSGDVPSEVANAKGLLDRRVAVLKELAFTETAGQVFSPDELIRNAEHESKENTNKTEVKQIAITGVDPTSIQMGRDAKFNIVAQSVLFAIHGTGLKQLSTNLPTIVSGDVDGVQTLYSGVDDVLILQGNVHSDTNGPVVFQLSTKGNTNIPSIAIYTKPIPVTAPPKVIMPPDLTPMFRRTLTTSTNKDGSTTATTEISISPDTDTNVMHLIQTISEPSDAAGGKLTVNLTVSTNSPPAK